MKIEIAIVILCIASITLAEIPEEHKKKLKPHQDACLAENGLTEDVLKEAEMKKMYPTDGSLDCFSACLFKRLGFISEEGELDEDIIRAMMSESIPEETLNKLLDNCRSESGKDLCETAGKLISCFEKYGPTIM